MSDRIGVVDRKTTETQIALRLNVDGQGTYTVSTGIRFFDHMLELFTQSWRLRPRAESNR